VDTRRGYVPCALLKRGVTKPGNSPCNFARKDRISAATSSKGEGVKAVAACAIASLLSACSERGLLAATLLV